MLAAWAAGASGATAEPNDSALLLARDLIEDATTTEELNDVRRELAKQKWSDADTKIIKGLVAAQRDTFNRDSTSSLTDE